MNCPYPARRDTREGIIPEPLSKTMPSLFSIFYFIKFTPVVKILSAKINSFSSSNFHILRKQFSYI